jgi:hypothetical protein
MTIGSAKENLTMRRILLWTATSILAVSFATGASAQNIDWQIFTEPFVTSAQAQEVNCQKVDDALGRKPAVSGDVRRYGFPRSNRKLSAARRCEFEAKFSSTVLIEASSHSKLWGGLSPRTEHLSRERTLRHRDFL